MRNAFAKQITAMAKEDSRIVLLSGDIGNRLFDSFKAAFPTRFFNCGVAEANMIGVAAGMAMSGLRPYCYTIAPFITYRCLEQIRIDLCYHQVPVVIIGTGSGLSYASLGTTHHSCEEIGMLRLIPGMTVIAPADAMELKGALIASIKHTHPIYVRIGKKGEPLVHATEPPFEIGKAIQLRDGSDALLVCAGTLLPAAVAAAELMAAKGRSAAVCSFPTIKPLDADFLEAAARKYRVIATLEEHSILGGLGGSIAEWLSDHPGLPTRLIRLGTPDEFLHLTCDTDEAREHFSLTAAAVADRLLNALS